MAFVQKDVNLSNVVNKPLIDNYKKKLSRHRLFNWIFLGSIFSALGLVGLLNFFVNPYGVFESPSIPGFNKNKVEKDNYDRFYKVADVIHLQPKAIILGSSRAKRGIDPDYLALKTHQLTYNLSLNNSNIHELLEYFKYSLKNQPRLHTVVIGLDIFMFNDYLKSPPTFNEARLAQNRLAWTDIINSLFSIDSLAISKNTILANRRDRAKSELLPNSKGFVPISQNTDGKMLSRINNLLDHYFNLYPRFQVSQKYLDDFRELVKIAQDNHIQLKVFLSPSHAIQLEADAKHYGWMTLENLKRELVRITPIWDFTGYNSVTGEPLAKNMKNYTDSSHYLASVGNWVVDRLFDPQAKTPPADFGVFINPENIEAHLATLRRDRETWKKNQRSNLKDCTLCDKFF
jgi:hypothetical protein